MNIFSQVKKNWTSMNSFPIQKGYDEGLFSKCSLGRNARGNCMWSCVRSLKPCYNVKESTNNILNRKILFWEGGLDVDINQLLWQTVSFNEMSSRCVLQVLRGLALLSYLFAINMPLVVHVKIITLYLLMRFTFCLYWCFIAKRSVW